VQKKGGGGETLHVFKRGGRCPSARREKEEGGVGQLKRDGGTLESHKKKRRRGPLDIPPTNLFQIVIKKGKEGEKWV